MQFVSLHSHTTMSSGDGFGLPKDHIYRIDDLGMSAIAFTDHRNTSAFVMGEQAAKERGVKLIYGCEFDVAMPNEPKRIHFHQTVLAMNEQGYQNLNRLVGLAWKQSKYVPRLYPGQLLDPEHTQGLIVLSGCADSMLSSTILGGKAFGDKKADWEQEDVQAGRRLIEQYQQVYGDRYYLELQQFPQLERSTILNQTFMDLSRVTGAVPVVTADVHCPLPEQNKIQQCLHAAHRGGTMSTVGAEWEYDVLLTYPTSDKQVFDNLIQQQLTSVEAEQAILTTGAIADRCNVELPKSPRVRYIAPKHVCSFKNEWCQECGKNEFFDVPDSQRAEFLLREAIEKGLQHRRATNPAFRARFDANEQAYRNRIVEVELPVIIDKDFCDYFLVTAELIVWAKDVDKQGVGPGRGSAAGSLLCYAIRITEIDPMQFPLMQFERFIDPTRPDMPDIDIDFSHPAAVFAHASELHGEDKISHIANFQRYRGKSAVADVGKAFEIPFPVLNTIKDQIVDRPDGDPRENDSVEDVFDAADAWDAAQDMDGNDPKTKIKAALEEFPELRMATMLEGNFRGLGVHAAGMVIANRPIRELAAVYSKENSKKERVEVISYDKRDAEYLDILKLDILGLATMKMVWQVVQWTDLTFEQLYAQPLDDQRVLSKFAEGDLVGIFQFEGRTTRSIVNQVFEGWSSTERVDFLTLADINALSRPGSLISGMTKRYVGIEQGRKSPRDYGYDSVNKIMSSTNGCLVYQEQVMSMGRDVAGMPGEKVGALRRIIGKKKAGGAFDAFYDEFRDGAKTHSGMTEPDAKELWDFMATSSKYLFNIAHAVSYGVIAYWAMWIKLTYPTEFFAAMLRIADKDQSLALMQDAARHGIKVIPPNPESSEESWIPLRGHLQAGFSQIDGVGEDKIGMEMKLFRDKTWGAPDKSKAINFAMLDVTWADFRYKAPRTKDVKIPCDPWMEEMTRVRTVTNDDGTKTKTKHKVMVEREHRKVKEQVAPAEGVSGFGPAMQKKFEEFSEAKDPFGIHTASNAVAAVVAAISTGELPLTEPNADAEFLPLLAEESVAFVGLVKEVKVMDVVEEEQRRNGTDPDVFLATLSEPSKRTKAKLICIDEHGIDVHVNVSRWDYGPYAGDINEIKPMLDVVHVVGTSREGFGPTVQAKVLMVIDLSEDE